MRRFLHKFVNESEAPYTSCGIKDDTDLLGYKSATGQTHQASSPPAVALSKRTASLVSAASALTCYACSYSKLSGVESGATNCKEPSSSAGTITLSAVNSQSCSSCKVREGGRGREGERE